ncbi:AAA family ATPase [Amorphus coralli]|uniref:bifunctional aminoglycoside phosphotransferase/ATP-binding protein n=1 Tax=Amorphus coralli TaxID=340680 RepID=UPI00037B63EC|nr:bifunctional aminoglycoside phosphotransferase/ATP-binding protein [Amorphus coralli]
MPDDPSTDAETDLQARVLAFLEDAATHGGHRPQRLETHAAIVILAGEDAFKIKRAVRYPYLDFSTLEKRRAACEREMEVNRAYAGQIYHGVVAITRDAEGRLAIDGDGVPVEWAVHMQRFDETATLDRTILNGPLPPDVLDALGDRLAEAHGEAARREAEPWIADLETYLDDNAASFARAPDLFPEDEARTLDRRAREALARIRPLLAARGAEGRIRHLHGDAHLGNVAMTDGAPLFFDAIEFDDRIATGDVLYDLAFLVMDIWRHGHRAEASRVFNRYLTVHGDRSDLAALAAFPFFLMMRAAIRAKVTAARMGFLEGEERRAAADDAVDAFRTACDFLAPEEPRLVAVGGFSGTGKTTLSRRLAPSIGRPPGAVHLRTDIIRKRHAGVALTERLPKETYTRTSSDAVYDDMLAQARIALGAGQGVLVDAVFAAEGERRAAERVAADAEAAFSGLWLQAPIPALEERVTARRGDASDADAAVVRAQNGYDIGDLSWATIETSGEKDDTLGAALAASAPVRGREPTG